MADMATLADGVVLAAKSYIGRALVGVNKRIDDLAAKVGGIPKGDPGKDAVVDYERVGALVTAAVKVATAELPIPKDGAPGATGERGSAGERGEKGEPGERGADGARGENGEPGERGPAGEHGTIGAAGAAGTNGKDGAPGINGEDAAPIHPDTLALLVVTEVAKALERAVAAIPRAKDGEPGRDAMQCEPLLAIDPTKGYPRGTYACFRGGLIRSFRATDPLAADGDLTAAGWAVMAQGIAGETEDLDDDGRAETRVTRYTDGTTLKRTLVRSVVIDRGVYREGQHYLKGDGVTWAGSYSIALRDTDSKPDSPDGSWRLAVRKGRDAK